MVYKCGRYVQNATETYYLDISFIFQYLHRNLLSVTELCVISHILYNQKSL